MHQGYGWVIRSTFIYSFMLVGEPFGCKTMVLETLSEGMTLLNQQGHDEEYEKVMYRIINPKSVTMGQLFGMFDPVSHEVSRKHMITQCRPSFFNSHA